MASSLPAAMLTELQHKARVHFTFDISLPNASGGTTTYRFAEKPVVSEANGLYLPYATEMGTVSRRTGFPTFGFQNPRTSVRIFDKERVLQKAIGGPASGKVMGSVANQVMRSFHVAEASHYTAMPGVVKDFGLAEEYVWEFVVGPDIEPLESKLKIPRLDELWQPNTLAQSIRTKPGRLVWGEFVSNGRSNEGTLECWFVDSTNKYWFVTNGHLADGSVTNVFVDGVSDTANWTLTRLLRNGNPITVIAYGGGSSLDEDNTITVDLTGLGDDGDGASTDTIERDPSEALKFTLANFAFNEWPKGAAFSATESNAYRWFQSDASIDSTSFSSALTYHALLNHEVAAVWTSDQSGLDVMTEYMNTWFLPIFWSDEFKLKIGLINLHERDIYPSSIIRKDLAEVQNISGQSFGENRVSRVNIDYLPDPVSGSFDRKFTATNDDLDFLKEEDIELTVGGPSKVP